MFIELLRELSQHSFRCAMVFASPIIILRQHGTPKGAQYRLIIRDYKHSTPSGVNTTRLKRDAVETSVH